MDLRGVNSLCFSLSSHYSRLVLERLAQGGKKKEKTRVLLPRVCPVLARVFIS